MMEILELNETQQGRYMKAYDLARRLLKDMGIFPRKEYYYEDIQTLVELDELKSSYPKLTLAMMYDIVRTVGRYIDNSYCVKDEKSGIDISTEYKLQDSIFYSNKDLFFSLIDRYLKGKKSQYKYPYSWAKVQGQLGTLLRLDIFDIKKENGLLQFDYSELTKNENISIIDLSDTDSPKVNNLVIAELLKGTLDKQNDSYNKIRKGSIEKEQQKVMVLIEEAHEFLSRERIKQMPTLKEQVARIAKRGRKRWLGLVFITQLPQHLPDEVLALINNYILHKIADANVINRLKKSVRGVDESLWRKLPSLVAGQAIVSAESLNRSLLVAIDPTPSYLHMVD
ncbi:MAG: ATP-binding protein [Bacteroidota bacterium]